MCNTNFTTTNQQELQQHIQQGRHERAQAFWAWLHRMMSPRTQQKSVKGICHA